MLWQLCVRSCLRRCVRSQEVAGGRSIQADVGKHQGLPSSNCVLEFHAHTRCSRACCLRGRARGSIYNLQDGVELGIFIKEAMQSAGKPFGELSPEQIGAALREYEMLRSHRVCHIIGKSGFIGNLFLFMGFLVSARCWSACLGARYGQRAALQHLSLCTGIVWACIQITRSSFMFRSWPPTSCSWHGRNSTSLCIVKLREPRRQVEAALLSSHTVWCNGF